MNAFKLGFWVFFTIALISSLVSLITQNQDLVSISIFNYTSPEQEKWVVLVSALAIGAVFSSLFFIVQLIVLETRNIRLRRANKQLERALAQYNPQLSNQYAQQNAGRGNNIPAVSPASSASLTSGPTVGSAINPSASLDPALDDEV